MMNVLLVEDDLDLAHTLVDYFELIDIQCDHADNGLLGYQLGKLDDYKTIVLDINIPLLDGFSLCRKLREEGVDTPIIMLTSKANIDDKLVGFDSGADDYLVKPFAMEELIARVNVLSKRRSGQAQRFTLGNLIVDKGTRTLSVSGNVLVPPPIEYKIMECLAASANQVVSKKQLMAYVWEDEVPKTDALKVHLYNLRKLLTRFHCQPTLETIKGVGIRLQVNHED